MPQAGHVVAGRYRLEQLLGTGGMGAVWEATQLSLSRRVAVKLVRADAVHTEIARRFTHRFTRETEVVSMLPRNSLELAELLGMRSEPGDRERAHTLLASLTSSGSSGSSGSSAPR